MRLWFYLALVVYTLVLHGCGGRSATAPDGGYYGGDAPPDSADMRDFDAIPDAVPRHEPLSDTGNKPYTVFGKRYTPMKSASGFTQTGTASWYGKKFHGRRTSSGETYDMWAMTAAHPVLPLPTYVRVSNLDNGASIIVKVNDRGPFVHNRIIDLSYAAAHKLGIAQKGTGRVTIAAIDPSRQADLPADTAVVVPRYEALTYEPASAYLLQIAAFRNMANALQVWRQLNAQGWKMYPRTDKALLVSGAPYRIQVGPYLELEEVLQLQKQLAHRFPDSIVLGSGGQ